MGHYDNLRPENCPVCGQARGWCDHNLVPLVRKNPVAKALRVTRRQVINSKKVYKREKGKIDAE